jgi:hypothetical protein
MLNRLQPYPCRTSPRAKTYYAAFHAAEAYIFEHTGKVAISHRGVRSEFTGLARREPRIDRELGRLLAHDGVWEGRQIILAQYMIDATTTRPSDAYLAPGEAMPNFGYGYFLWLLPGDRRQFALVGANGQRICVDPASKLIMVQTAVENTDEVWRLWSALVEQLGQG